MISLIPLDDPPFYLSHKIAGSNVSKSLAKSSTPTSDGLAVLIPPAQQSPAVTEIEYRLEDFRGVIDDLTVENRNLRRKLRQLQQLHHTPFQVEKLLELHVHGLSISERRKLERLLQAFVSGVLDVRGSTASTTSTRDSPPNAFWDGYSGSKPSFSPASNFCPVDSAYASNSTSGTALGLQPRHAPPSICSQLAQGKDTVGTWPSTCRSSLPRRSPLMSEKAKQQLVVMKLEQVFTGKKASSSKDEYYQKQQNVPLSPAGADRRQTAGCGQRVRAEGVREAKMSSLCPSQIQGPRTHIPSLDVSDELSPRGTTGPSDLTPDQRPTRPLDLDLSQAQNSNDNITYMKHLGFSSPKKSPDKVCNEGEGWIYLNLLMNMAQLHTAHVTPDFVRMAVRETSAKIELSSDGRSVRWKGCAEGTRMTGRSGSTEHGNDSVSNDFDITSYTGHAITEGVLSNPVSGPQAAASYDSPRREFRAKPRCQPLRCHSGPYGNYTSYTPLFAHGTQIQENPGGATASNLSMRSASEEDSSLYEQNAARPLSATSTFPSSHNMEALGPIIIYDAAEFYVDLSCDIEIRRRSLQHNHETPENVLGIPHNLRVRPAANESFTKGPVSTEQPFEDSISSSFTFSPSSPLNLGWPSPAGAQTSLASPLVQLNASGLGGVRPDDNFTLQVLTERSVASGKKVVRHFSVQKSVHQAASLPSPTYAFLPHSSSSSDNEDSTELSDEGESRCETSKERELLGYVVSPYSPRLQFNRISAAKHR